MNPNDRPDNLPRYRCHKEVEALKIKQIEIRIPEDQNSADNEVWITPYEDGYSAFRVSWEYYNRNKPEAGGFWVRYKDGFESWSPAEAFEDGYSKL